MWAYVFQQRKKTKSKLYHFKRATMTHVPSRPFFHMHYAVLGWLQPQVSQKNASSNGQASMEASLYCLPWWLLAVAN